MRTHIIKTVIASLLLAISSNASVLYLELPEEITPEMVQYPTDIDRELVRDFVIAEVNKIDTDVADRVVILTKDGDVLK